MTTGASAANPNPIADLVIPMLAVNNWRLEQSGAIFDDLDREGLFEPARIIKMTHAELHAALKRAGYNKSSYVVDLLCDRLFDMASKLKGQEDKFRALSRDPSNPEFVRLCLDISGVGPKVLSNLRLLLESCGG